MTFEERVDFYVAVYGMSREDAERRACVEVRPPDLQPVELVDPDDLDDLWGDK